MVAENIGSKDKLPGFRPSSASLLDVTCVPFLRLHFRICKVGMMTALPCGAVVININMSRRLACRVRASFMWPVLLG